MTRDDSEIRLFRAKVIRRALRIGLILFLVSFAFRSREVTIGLLFGLCVGFFNFDLMFKQNLRLLSLSAKPAGKKAAMFFILRYGVIALAGAAVLWKGLNPVSALVGFFVLHFVLVTYDLIESMKRRFLSV